MKRKPASLGYRDERRRLLKSFETEYVWRALKLARGNVSEAARIAQVDRKHFWRIMRRNGVRVSRVSVE